jgi:BirA family biotin operon repressor/biotin-[acetyl-CoA-carboxylase] ligase
MDDVILRALKTRPATVSELAERCQTSEEIIRARLLQLELAGFVFTAHPALGITLSDSPKHLVGDLILSAIPEDCAPKSITVYQSTRSTNDLAHQAALNNSPRPAVFIAEEQSGGRGRNGKSWSSPPNLGLWMSLLLTPNHPLQHWPRITTTAATLIANTLRSTLSLPVQIKWPNDLWIGSSKLAGVIAETGTSSQGPYVVLGIGINALHSSSDFPPELRSTATSLKIHLAQPPCRNALASNVLRTLAQIDHSISDQGFSAILQEARKLSCVIDKSIEFDLNGERLSGRAIDLNDEGHLVLLTADGSERILHSGEVTHIRPSC